MVYLFIIIFVFLIYWYNLFFSDILSEKQTTKINELLKNVQGFKKFKTDGYGYFYRSGDFSKLHNRIVAEYLTENKIEYKIRKDCMVIHFKVKKSSLDKFFKLKPIKNK